MGKKSRGRIDTGADDNNNNNNRGVGRGPRENRGGRPGGLGPAKNAFSMGQQKLQNRRWSSLLTIGSRPPSSISSVRKTNKTGTRNQKTTTIESHIRPLTTADTWGKLRILKLVRSIGDCTFFIIISLPVCRIIGVVVGVCAYQQQQLRNAAMYVQQDQYGGSSKKGGQIFFFAFHEPRNRDFFNHPAPPTPQPPT